MHRKPLLTLIGVAASLSSAIFLSNSAHALSAPAAPPDIEISLASGTTTSANLVPTTNSKDWNNIEMPIKIKVNGASSYAISVYNSCSHVESYLADPANNDPADSKNLLSKCQKGSLVDLSSGHELESTTGLAVLPDLAESNKWGYRWQMDGKYNTAPSSDRMQKTFTAIPTTVEAGALATIGDNGQIYLASRNYTTGDSGDTLTLEVGAGVNGNLPSGNYQGAIGVAVTATPKDVASFGALHYMQEMTAEECAKIEIPAGQASFEGYLEDERDHKIYKVAKLKDGNCWMIQNLSLWDKTAEGEPMVLTSADSDIPTGSIPASAANNYQADTYIMPTSGVFGANGGMANGSYVPNTDNTLGFIPDPNGPQQGIETPGSNGCSSNNTACNGANSGSYYSWTTAVANSSSSITRDDNAPASICPKGWKLPTGDDERPETQFAKLYSLYGSLETFSPVWRIFSPSDGRSGYILNTDSSLYHSGDSGYWWSRTVYGEDISYYLRLTVKSGFKIANNPSRLDGYPVRCVVDQTKPTMQNFTANDCSNLVGETELVDSRDSKVYKVAKLEDGNCWMVQNLALDSGTTEATRRTITPADSDISENYTLPISSTAGFYNDNEQFMYNGTHKGLAFGDVIYENTEYDTDGDGNNTGAYYSWLTATAGSGADLSTTNTNASSSICPKGWKLPTGGADAPSADSPKIQNGQFQRLYDKYGDLAGFRAVWNSEFPGRYTNNALGGSGTFSDWWSSTVYSEARAYYLNIESSGITRIQGDLGRWNGSSVRCVKTPN